MSRHYWSTLNFARSRIDITMGLSEKALQAICKKLSLLQAWISVQVDKVDFLSQDVEKVNLQCSESARGLHEIPCSMFQAMCRSDDRKVNGYLWAKRLSFAVYISQLSQTQFYNLFISRVFSVSDFISLRIKSHFISDLKISALTCKLLAVLMDSPLGARSDYKSDYSRTYGKHGVRSSGWFPSLDLPTSKVGFWVFYAFSIIWWLEETRFSNPICTRFTTWYGGTFSGRWRNWRHGEHYKSIWGQWRLIGDWYNLSQQLTTLGNSLILEVFVFFCYPLVSFQVMVQDGPQLLVLNASVR